ncbi:APC8A [Auxenochlorella protothecoides x Auxenochlorella symbiontica]
MSIVRELRQAVVDCNARGLMESSRWAAQQLAGLPEEETGTGEASLEPVQPVWSREDDRHALARCHFDVKEYRSAAHVLSDCTSPKSTFLRLYSLYLAGEKRKEEERAEAAGGRPPRASPQNAELEGLEAELSRLCAGPADGFLLYLLGLVRLDGASLDGARQALVAAVRAYPANWCAWKALQRACPDLPAALALGLPEHPARAFFLASLAVDLHDSGEALGWLEELAPRFPASDVLVQLAAEAHYNLQNFDEAQALFEDLLARDPHRLEGMDVYSNILYVKEESAALSHLAHSTALNDKYRTETCCIIGNYHSLKGQHERAAQYFRRALKLNPNCLSAWTLMGHEYVELKNPPAAIEAYRRAVDVNPRDYRAWYGLGQTYELVDMPYHALYYFKRAVFLRPRDARMWNAMGHCFQAGGEAEYGLAIRCHMRALPHDKEGVSLHELAKLHARLGQRAQAAHYHRLVLERMDAEGLEGQDAVEALTYLADCYEAEGDSTAAEACLTRLLEYGAHSKESARSAMDQLRCALGSAATPVRPDTPPSR